MELPKDRANDPKRKPVKEESSKKDTYVSPFADNPKDRNTGWFFSGKY